MPDVKLPIELVEAVLVDLRIQATQTGAPARHKRIAQIAAALADAVIDARCTTCGHSNIEHRDADKREGPDAWRCLVPLCECCEFDETEPVEYCESCGAGPADADGELPHFRDCQEL